MYKNFKIYIEDPINRKYVNAYFKGFDLTFRLFEKESSFEVPNNLLDVSSLYTQNDLTGYYFKLNQEENTYFKCVYTKTITLDLNIWKPYREIYLVYTLHPDRRDSACFIDKYSDSFISKVNHNTWNKKIKVTGAATLMKWIVLPDTNLETAPCFMSNDVNVITNINFDKAWEYIPGEDKPIIDAWKDYYIPKVHITGPSEIKENSTESFEISVTHHEDEPCLDSHTYYVECMQGYAPNREIKVVDGRGTFKIMALGLNPGETLRFKINDRVWSDKAEKVLNVT